MARILTGIQASGRPHLGNILGAILPAVRVSQKPENESFLFIADLHAMTTIKSAQVMQENTRAVAAAWLAFGFDSDKNFFYRQSRLAGYHTELCWYLSCLTPYPMLANAHSFKDKSDRLADVNAGLFTYPVLQAADIVLYQANFVPVGKDQKQHLEMSKDMAEAFNRIYGDTFVLPEAVIDEQVMTIPGIDGNKMSKSYNNFLDIFLPEKDLYTVIKKIQTDSTPLEEPKNPDTCLVFTLFSLIAEAAQTQELRAKYEAGNFGYGHAKKELLDLILTRFAEERRLFNYYFDHPTALEEKLQEGEAKARVIAEQTMLLVRERIGFI